MTLKEERHVVSAEVQRTALTIVLRQGVERVEHEAEAARQRRGMANGSARLNRATRDFMRDGAGSGDRHRLLFSAAANLAEFGCPVELAHELLTEAALDSGLSPGETRRQIDCGLNHSRRADKSRHAEAVAWSGKSTLLICSNEAMPMRSESG